MTGRVLEVHVELSHCDTALYSTYQLDLVSRQPALAETEAEEAALLLLWGSASASAALPLRSRTSRRAVTPVPLTMQSARCAAHQLSLQSFALRADVHILRASTRRRSRKLSALIAAW